MKKTNDEIGSNDQPISRTEELRKELHIMVDKASPEQIEKLSRFIAAFLG
jgi:hypothetical protein